jgi:uncharacterized protein (TIGR02145 family)
MKKTLSALIMLLVFSSLSGQEKLIDERDGNSYSTITIDSVTWMSQNLKFMSKTGASYYNNDKNNIEGYGLLYNWKTALTVCPRGWHLPSEADFRRLSNHFEQKESWKKEASDPNSFNIQFGGLQDYEGTFSEMDESAYYWTSTDYNSTNAAYFSYLIINDMPVIDISRIEDIADIHGTEKSNRYSVRCVKNP